MKIKARYTSDEYQSLKFLRYRKLIGRLVRDLGFQCSDRLIATAWHGAGVPAYVYTMSFDFGVIDRALGLGDFHSSGTIFLFRAALLNAAKLQPFAGDAFRMADVVQCLWAILLIDDQTEPRCVTCQQHVPRR